MDKINYTTHFSFLCKTAFSLDTFQGNGRLKVPDKTSLDALVTSCAGDIRGAINALQFSSHTGQSDLSIIFLVFCNMSIDKILLL